MIINFSNWTFKFFFIKIVLKYLKTKSYFNIYKNFRRNINFVKNYRYYTPWLLDIIEKKLTDIKTFIKMRIFVRIMKEFYDRFINVNYLYIYQRFIYLL
jgi:hypothetical protein